MTDKVFGEKIENVSYRRREGAYLIIIENQKAAAVKIPKGYFLLGGGLEDGESHEECIKRECLEEIGFDVQIDGYICSGETYCIHSKLGYFHPVQYYYYGKLLKKTAEPVEKDHVLVWIPLEEIEEKFFSRQQAWAVRHYVRQWEREHRRI